ncbi:MAG: glycerol-3-phosphate dehydrogenase/oxidase [Deltaproteobacteria bacterium]|nr:glycerol-3-phosphate dehydrogenase/oxidase [Deltaproteobacteria bacterium]
MTASFSLAERGARFQALADTRYELVVIGGGITGAGIFRDAVLRGLKVLLVEKEDYASGTSSKSSKLVHGGLRYLQHFHIRLTRESCRERELLLQLNPHLVRPMPFLFPVYRDHGLPASVVSMGLSFYEFLAGPSAIRHRLLKPAQIAQYAPTLDTSALRRAALYYDSTVDDSRLVIENVLSGVAAGGHALNYTAAIGFETDQGRIVGVRLRDQESQQTTVVRADHVVNACGIHCDTVRRLIEQVPTSMLRASKGVHLVVPRERLPLELTVAYANRIDGRLMFAVPWYDVVLVGTTDTFDNGDVRVTESADYDYVMGTLRASFKGFALEDQELISSIAGVRTLIVDPRTNLASASSVSREHAIYHDPSGLISIAGGKLTTYRTMALEIVDLVIERLPAERQAELKPCATDREPLGGSVDAAAKQAELERRFGIGTDVAMHLVRTYGARSHEPIEQQRERRAPCEPLIAGAPFLRCELPYIARTEGPVHLEDILARRLRVALWARGQALAEADDAAELVGHTLGWNAEQQRAEAERYRALVKREFRPLPVQI